MTERTVYTYVVDHGNESPRIGGGDTVNGGKILKVAFDSDVIDKIFNIQNIWDACDGCTLSKKDFERLDKAIRA